MKIPGIRYMTLQPHVDPQTIYYSLVHNVYIYIHMYTVLWRWVYVIKMPLTVV